MRRSQIIQLSIVTSVAASLLSCSDPPTRYCVDQNQKAADERNCQTSSSSYHWYYGGNTGYVSPGTRLSGGSSQAPSEGFTTSEGTVRGGIGASGEAMSGGHGGAGE
jgi:hypothetical protein